MLNEKEYFSVQPKTMDEVNQRAEAMDQMEDEPLQRTNTD